MKCALAHLIKRITANSLIYNDSIVFSALIGYQLKKRVDELCAHGDPSPAAAGQLAGSVGMWAVP
jgi:hypothetical protein